ncbi:MAG: hypothetical protein MUQ10_10730, partial [Anaerolineae bacterium]|nr:hypothetical protein [Anaerolineae bacterium]
MGESFFSGTVNPDWEGFLSCIMRQGTPDRVYHIELFLDQEVQEAVCERFDLLSGLDLDGSYFSEERTLRIQRFLGYDYVRQGIDRVEMPLHRLGADDTAALLREGGRYFVAEGKGPITTWEEFEQYPWPDPETQTTRSLEWYERNLPDDMCVIGSGGFAHYAEYITWLMGYETLCYALYDQRDLVTAIADRL